ncbi:MAG: hypothetical protein ACFE0O_01865 [Opitutales bacterium]
MKSPTFCAFLLSGLYLFFAGSMEALVINEVSPTENRVEFLNDGTDPVDLSGHWLCSRLSYIQLGDGDIQVVSGSLMLEPGAFLVVDTSAGLDLDDTGADLGLYETNSFGSASAMVDFLQWGSSSNPSGRESVAVDAGIWAAGSFTDVPESGESLIFAGSGGGVDAWSISSTPSFGSANDSGSGGDASVGGWLFFDDYPFVWSNDEQDWLFIRPEETGAGIWIYSFKLDKWTFRDQSGGIFMPGGQ